MCQHLGNLNNSVNHYFPNHACVQKVKVQDRPVEFKCNTIRKLTDTDSDSTLQPNFKKLSPAELWCNIKENIRNYLKRPLKYSSFFLLQVCIRLNFLRLFQPNNKSQQIECRNKMRIQLSSIKPNIKKRYKNVQCHSLF